MTLGQKTSHRPQVTIGMPVYNEAPFIDRALSSLRRQDYKNCRILISDNASTDETGAICARIAEKDDRVVYLRSDRNIGAAANFQRLAEMATGKYFMWAAGHDEWSENLISESVAALESNPTAAIAFATSYWIDEEGTRTDRMSGYTDTRGMDPIARFFTIFWGNMHPVLGVIRLDYLRRTRGAQSFVGVDLVVLCELVLMGDFVHVPGAWWHRREVRSTETHRQRMRRYTSGQTGIAKSWVDRKVPLLRLPVELIRAVHMAQLPWIERLCILLGLLPSLPVRYVAGRRRLTERSSIQSIAEPENRLPR